jgi:hypothetical protein
MRTVWFSIGVTMIGVVGWTQLSLGVAGCGPAAEGEGEGEGEGDEAPETAGGVTFSDTVFEANHEVGTTDCPQEVEPFSLTNGSGEDRVVNFAFASPNLRVTDDAGGELAFVSLAPDQEFAAIVRFTCATTTSFEEEIPATVTEGDAVTEVGAVTLSVTVDISGG